MNNLIHGEMTPEKIKELMIIAAANGDWKHYHKLESKLK